VSECERNMYAYLTELLRGQTGTIDTARERMRVEEIVSECVCVCVCVRERE